jgi:hypothetical protein
LAKRRRNAIGSLVRFAALGLSVASAHCSSDEERPPPYVHPGIDEPRSCTEVATRGSLAGSEILVDGQRAHCAVENLECPLEGTLEFSGRCDGGSARAFCRSNDWRFSCVRATDGGIEGGP